MKNKSVMLVVKVIKKLNFKNKISRIKVVLMMNLKKGSKITLKKKIILKKKLKINNCDDFSLDIFIINY